MEKILNQVQNDIDLSVHLEILIIKKCRESLKYGTIQGYYFHNERVDTGLL